jgi:hypothetical protein
MIRLSSAFVVIGAAGFMVIGASYAMGTFVGMGSVHGDIHHRRILGFAWSFLPRLGPEEDSDDWSGRPLTSHLPHFPKSHQPATAIGSHTYAVPRLPTGRAMFALSMAEAPRQVSRPTAR